MNDYIKRDEFVEHYRKLLCEDCDRRKGMKNGKMRFCYEIGGAPCRACAVDDMLTYVEDFPAADVVERKVGRWIDDGDCAICSKCMKAYTTGALYANYCPNCGARMDGEA